ncbi:unnamed protein product [Acanthoscelides obtectus]|uniref:PiggyBac transposable element-derived protein domain-containing protein n=1 Tax=Acanthoscelides obtectus TaxID=200917 RepID=A0A9P0M2Q2_ACAOB|nr:unnamed protein product [Acanthoscelides obtectus]CAK1665451.1 PiggyBac transposable element-derived protein 4 [Acanthoscelides obtectus]
MPVGYEIVIDQMPGPRQDTEPCMKKQRTNKTYKQQSLTDDELRTILEESDIEEDPFLNDSDDDPEYNASSSSDSDEEIDQQSRPGTPVTCMPGPPVAPSTSVATTSQWFYQEVHSPKIPFTGGSGAADPQLSGALHSEKVVLSLLQEYLGVGHSVFMDNFYNSVKLTKDLLDKKTYVTGTLRSNRRGNPPEVLAKKLKKGELIIQFNTEGICVVKWKDRREILAISNEFSGQLDEVTTQRGQVVMKPMMINAYNKFMAGIDHCDQMLAYYSCEHKTLIWYKKLAVHIFQIMLLNSFYLYKKGTGSRKGLYDFRLDVIRKLIGPQPPDPVPMLNLQHLPEYCPKGENGKAKRRRCNVCWSNGQRKDSVYYCPQCPGGPGFCLTPCFRVFHAKQ